MDNVHHQEQYDFLERGGDDRLIAILNKGLDNRLMRSTDANEASSRSHLLFSITFSHTGKKSGNTVSGKVMFVDLAGSERLAKLGFNLHLYEEALFINESLAVLGRTIWRLSKGQEPAQVNYELNILTSLLKDTLGGEAKTLLYVCIGPSIMDIEATRDTLRFAESTGKIQASTEFITNSQLSKFMVQMVKCPPMTCLNPQTKITSDARAVPNLSHIKKMTS